MTTSKETDVKKKKATNAKATKPTKRAEPAYGMEATHVTNTTRKYQCNAALTYAKAIKKLCKEHELPADGAAIRMVLEAGLKALGFKSLVDEVEAERTEREAE